MRRKSLHRATPGLLLVLATLTAGLVLTACGGGSSSSSSSSGGTESSKDSGGSDGPLIVGVPALPVTFDAMFAPGQQSVEAINNLYDPLTIWKTSEDPEGFLAADIGEAETGIEGAMLSKVDVSNGGKTYKLHVRKGVKDSAGEELDAEDIKYTFDRAFGTEAVGAYIMALANIPSDKAVKVVDPMTVQVDIPNPNPLFMRLLTVHTTNPWNKKVVEEHATPDDPWATKWLTKNSAGFGAYSVKSFTPTEVVFASNPNYWKGAPAYSEVIYKQIPESSQRLALVQSNQIDIAEGLSAVQLESLEGNPEVETIRALKNEFVYAAANGAKAPLDDPKVRQALNYATPAEQIAEVVYKGKAEPTKNLVPASYPNYDPALSPFSFDPTKAKALLKEAGAEGLQLTITVNSDIPEASDIAVQLQDGYAEAGIDLEIEKKPTAAYLAAAEGGETELWLQQSYSIVPDIAYHYATYVSVTGPLSYDAFEEPKYDGLIAQASKTPEGPVRDQMLVELQEIVGDLAPQVSIVTVPTSYGIAGDVSGYTWYPNNQIRFVDLSPSS